MRSAPGWNMWKFTPKGAAVSARTRSIAGPTSSGTQHCGGQEAKAAGVAGGGHQLRARDPAHGGLDDRVAAAQPLAQDRVQRVAHEALAGARGANADGLPLITVARMPWGSSLRMIASCSAEGPGGRGHRS